jgi:tRNA A58 N-methylase Trm61
VSLGAGLADDEGVALLSLGVTAGRVVLSAGIGAGAVGAACCVVLSAGAGVVASLELCA